MQFEVSNKIVARDYSKELLDFCKAELILDNPEYIKKERMGLWLGNIPREIVLYEKSGNNLVLPFGCVGRLLSRFSGCRFYSRICPVNRVSYDSGINLYPYQEKAVEKALEAKNGVLVMPCGAGKTQTAIEIIARLGLKTLWLTHTQDLLSQSMNRAKSVLGIDLASYGTITGGKVDIGRGITFATIQTMCRLDLTQYRDEFGVVVVDECHHAIGSPTRVMQFYKVMSNLSCRYKFGLTATPKRADGLERSMFALIGDIIHEVSKEEVKDTTCPVDVRFIETSYFPDLDVALSGDGTLNYSGLVNDMINNKKRFSLVLNSLQDFEKPMLVLGNRVEYLERLNEAYTGKSVCLSTMGNSKAAKQKRKEALASLNEGKLDCIFATYQLAKEGLDVPNLRTVVLATPEKDETTVSQAAGRVGRKSEGKEKGTVIDFTDAFGMLKGWSGKRKRFYKKIGYNILT